MDKKDLKIEAYKQRVSELDEKNADYRVEITLLDDKVRELQQRVAELEAGEQPTYVHEGFAGVQEDEPQVVHRVTSLE